MNQHPQDPQKPSNRPSQPYSGDKVVSYAGSGGGGRSRLIPLVLALLVLGAGGWWWWNSQRDNASDGGPGPGPTTDGPSPAPPPERSELLAVDPSDPIDGPSAAEEAAWRARVEREEQAAADTRAAPIRSNRAAPSHPSSAPPPPPPSREMDDVAREVAALNLENSGSRQPTAPGGDEPLEVQGDVVAPLLFFSPAPEYTAEARNARIQGVVILRAVIDENGRVEDVQVVRGLPMGLDRKAVAAARTWEFHPATLHGEPVRVYHEVRLEFTLN